MLSSLLWSWLWRRKGTQSFFSFSKTFIDFTKQQLWELPRLRIACTEFCETQTQTCLAVTWPLLIWQCDDKSCQRQIRIIKMAELFSNIFVDFFKPKLFLIFIESHKNSNIMQNSQFWVGWEIHFLHFFTKRRKSVKKIIHWKKMGVTESPRSFNPSKDIHCSNSHLLYYCSLYYTVLSAHAPCMTVRMRRNN